jgi:hypothetical protein
MSMRLGACNHDRKMALLRKIRVILSAHVEIRRGEIVLSALQLMLERAVGHSYLSHDSFEIYGGTIRTKVSNSSGTSYHTISPILPLLRIVRLYLFTWRSEEVKFLSSSQLGA